MHLSSDLSSPCLAVVLATASILQMSHVCVNTSAIDADCDVCGEVCLNTSAVVGAHFEDDGADGALDLLQQESLFTMFCMVYEYFLMTADNDDLYTRQYPFELQQVRTMVETLKRIIYPMYASRLGTHAPPPPAHAAAAGSGDTAMLEASGVGLAGWAAASNMGCRVKLSESAKKLRAAGTKLLNRLYERNCHRAFMGDEEWLAPQWFPLDDSDSSSQTPDGYKNHNGEDGGSSRAGGK